MTQEELISSIQEVAAIPPKALDRVKEEVQKYTIHIVKTTEEAVYDFLDPTFNPSYVDIRNANEELYIEQVKDNLYKLRNGQITINDLL